MLCEMLFTLVTEFAVPQHECMTGLTLTPAPAHHPRKVQEHFTHSAASE